MRKICFVFGGDKFHLPRRICINLEYYWPPHWPISGPGPVEDDLEIDGKPLGVEIVALAGLIQLGELKALSSGAKAQLKSASEHMIRELKSQLPEGTDILYEPHHAA